MFYLYFYLSDNIKKIYYLFISWILNLILLYYYKDTIVYIVIYNKIYLIFNKILIINVLTQFYIYFKLILVTSLLFILPIFLIYISLYIVNSLYKYEQYNFYLIIKIIIYSWLLFIFIHNNYLFIIILDWSSKILFSNLLTLNFQLFPTFSTIINLLWMLYLLYFCLLIIYIFQINTYNYKYYIYICIYILITILIPPNFIIHLIIIFLIINFLEFFIWRNIYFKITTLYKMELIGLEPTTFYLQSKYSTN